jgi:molybdopterin-biosynthesis enzyme MoeA-like protein
MQPNEATDPVVVLEPDASKGARPVLRGEGGREASFLPSTHPQSQTPTRCLTLPPGIGLVIVGDEILSGKRADKHMAKVIELLGARGLQLDWAEYVGDRLGASPPRSSGRLNRRRGGVLYRRHRRHARRPHPPMRRAALGVPLELHPEAEALIRERMQDVAREQGVPYEPDRPDNIHRLNMGVFPQGARIIPNPYNKIPGFSVGHVHFVPGFPVMAWPMVEWVLDTQYPHLHRQAAYLEKSVIVFGAMEATLTPLMEAIERAHPGVKVFSLPSVDHPQYGRHIELGVKGAPAAVARRPTRRCWRACNPLARSWALNWCVEYDAPIMVHSGFAPSLGLQWVRLCKFRGEAPKLKAKCPALRALVRCTSFGTKTAFPRRQIFLTTIQPRRT